jgi:hypothetical protein
VTNWLKAEQDRGGDLRGESRASGSQGFGLQKKEGAAREEISVVPRDPGIAGPPEGWERAMEALWGPQWTEVYGAWGLMPPSDHAQVRRWLAREKGKEVAA